MRTVPVVLGGAVRTAIGGADLGQFHGHAHLHEGCHQGCGVVGHELELVGLHDLVQLLHLGLDTVALRGVLHLVQLRTKQVALLLPIIQVADVVQEDLVLLAHLHHQVLQQVGGIGGQLDHRFVHHHLEELGPRGHNGIHAGLVAAGAVEHHLALGVGYGGVSIVQLAAVVVGEVDGVLAGAGNGRFDHPLGGVLGLGGGCKNEGEQYGKLGGAVERPSIHGGESSGWGSVDPIHPWTKEVRPGVGPGGVKSR